MKNQIILTEKKAMSSYHKFMARDIFFKKKYKNKKF